MSPPVSATRIAAVDLARGIAIVGTLATNVWIFTHPQGLIGFFNGDQSGMPEWARLAENWLTALVNGKFLGLLTLLFGIGVAIQFDSAKCTGSLWPGRYRWRALLLLVDGALHYVLVTEFDILMGYAVTGLVLAYVLLASERVQAWVVVGAAAVHVALLAAVVAALSTTTGDVGRLAVNPYADFSFFELAHFRLENIVAFRAEPVFITFYSIAMFGVGAMLYRAGIFTPERWRLRRTLLAVGSLAFVADVVTNALGGIPGFFIARYGLAAPVAVGLLALIAGVCCRRAGQGGAVGRGLNGVGRTALSCYVGQNLLASFVCYGWGLGLASRVNGAWRVPFTLALWLGITAVMVVAANVWLRRFRRGPLEWLWARGVDVLDRRPAEAASQRGSGVA